MLRRILSRGYGIVSNFGNYSRLRVIKSVSLTNQATQQAKESKAHLLLLVIPVTTFGLGSWQVYRRQWKLGLIKQLEERTTSPPIDVPENILDLNSKDFEYRRVRIRGKFDHTMEFHVAPRSLTGSSGGLGKKPKSGTHIITPFELSNTGEKILVNRGWVPRNKSKPDTRTEGQIEEEVEVIAFVRKNEQVQNADSPNLLKGKCISDAVRIDSLISCHLSKRAPFQPNNDPERNQWYYRDVESMAALSGCLPVQLDADAGSTIPGGPIGGQTRVTLRNEHLQYIITWYALSAATAYMYYKLRKKPQNAFRS